MKALNKAVTERKFNFLNTLKGYYPKVIELFAREQFYRNFGKRNRRLPLELVYKIEDCLILTIKKDHQKVNERRMFLGYKKKEAEIISFLKEKEKNIKERC